MYVCPVLLSLIWTSGTPLWPVTMSASVPDGSLSPRLERADRSLRSASFVRLTTRRAQFVVRDVRVDALGVNWARVVDRGTLDSLSAPGTLAWGEVVELDRSTYRGLSGAKTGAIWLGSCAALGVGMAAAVAGADINSLGAAFFGGVFGAGVGAAVGGVIGTPVRHWQQVYP
jgi:hypothetical protein